MNNTIMEDQKVANLPVRHTADVFQVISEIMSKYDF